MERRLPTIEIEGSIFFVDVRMGGLRNSEGPFNVLEFKDMERHYDVILEPQPEDFPRHGYHAMRFFYNSVKKEIVSAPVEGNGLPPNVVYLEILNEHFLDPVGVELMKGHAIEQIPQTLLGDKLHFSREIPTVEVLGQQFFVDCAKMSLYQVTDFSNKVSFDFVEVLPIDEMLAIHVDKNGRVRNVPGMDCDNEDRLVVLKQMQLLDPIGYRRNMGEPVLFFKHIDRIPQRQRIVSDQDKTNGMKI
ncbi:hypothetical protein [Chitinophaga defluvii]|uniref:Uncharacterized protein n=1 Tax=Chitinophaga defluvii TaxID=3163343 RepID=A0ABV2T8V3_9BACT